MTAPSRYYVHGIELVNCGGESCEACEKRPGVGRSISGSVVCARCAGMAAVLAGELAQEVEAARVRKAAKDAAALTQVRAMTAQQIARSSSRSRVHSPTHFPCGHPRTSANTFTHFGKSRCRECRAACARAQRKEG